jgi:hypothetical protein
MTSDGLTSVTGMKDEDLDVVGLKQEDQVSSVMSPMHTVFIFRLRVDIYYRFNKKKQRKKKYFFMWQKKRKNNIYIFFFFLTVLTINPPLFWKEDCKP